MIVHIEIERTPKALDTRDRSRLNPLPVTSPLTTWLTQYYAMVVRMIVWIFAVMSFDGAVQ